MAFWKNYVAKPIMYAILGLGTVTAGKLVFDYVAPLPLLSGVYSGISNSVASSLSKGAKYTDPKGGVVEVRRFNSSEAENIGGAVGGLAAVVLTGAAVGLAGAGIIRAGNSIRGKIRSW